MSDSRYTTLHFLSQVCSLYQEEAPLLTLVRQSYIERAIILEIDTIMGITSFKVQPIWFIKGGYNSPERPSEKDSIPEVDLFKFQGMIYQRPTDGITTGWSSDKKISFELHVTDKGQDFLGVIFHKVDTGKIFKYEASPGALKKGIYILNR